LKKQKGVEDIELYLKKIMASITNLNSLYSDNQNYTFFQVQTRLLKEELVSKAKGIKSGFLQKLSLIISKNVKVYK